MTQSTARLEVKETFHLQTQFNGYRSSTHSWYKALVFTTPKKNTMKAVKKYCNARIQDQIVEYCSRKVLISVTPLTGNFVIGALLTFGPKLSSINCSNWTTSWDRPLLFGGSACTYCKLRQKLRNIWEQHTNGSLRKRRCSNLASISMWQISIGTLKHNRFLCNRLNLILMLLKSTGTGKTWTNTIKILPSSWSSFAPTIHLCM